MESKISKEKNDNFNKLNDFQSGPAVDNLITIIGDSALRYSLRIYRIMRGFVISGGKETEKLRRICIEIARYIRELQNKPVMADEEYREGIRNRLIADCMKTSEKEIADLTDKEFESTLFFEGLEIVRRECPNEVHRCETAQVKPNHRQKDYPHHFLIFSLNHFIRRANISKNRSAIAISDFFASQKDIDNTSVEAVRKSLKRQDKEEVIKRLQSFYEECQLIYTAQVQEIIGSERIRLLREVVYPPSHKKPALSLLFPDWEEVFTDNKRNKTVL